MIAGATVVPTPPGEIASAAAARVRAGARLAGLFGTADEGGVRLRAVLAEGDGLAAMEAEVPTPPGRYPSLTPQIPAASWYERELHDLFGLVPEGHPRLTGLVLPRPDRDGPPRPMPGGRPVADRIEPVQGTLPTHVGGPAVFTIPYGPVRSGVFESVEFLVETPGEEIPHVRPRVFFKHRGLEKRFEGMPAADGVLLAERVEGVSSVAHALAFCQALERLAGLEVPPAAAALRVAHAELERLANHLDVAARLAEPAGLAVALARFSLHKERVLRLRATLCGGRFGRGAIVPGGVAEPIHRDPGEVIAKLDRLERDLRRDVGLLMETASFLDRLRGTGTLPAEVARDRGALGPVGRASGLDEDVRASRPYAAYERLGFRPASSPAQGDALARLQVRWDEAWESLRLAREAVRDAAHRPAPAWRDPAAADLDGLSGEAFGWAEAAQGEVLTMVAVEDGRIRRCKPRSASFHNLAVFPLMFRGDILTDFAFIEGSIGVSVAGVSG